jgi:hypothetical protein
MLWCVFLSFPTSIFAENSDEVKLKSAFIYNFINFVEQDINEVENYYYLCVLGKTPLMGALKKLQNRTRKGLPIMVKEIATPENIKEHECDALYIGDIKPKQLKTVITKSIKHSIVTISDHSGYLDKGIIFNIKLLMGRLRFDVNVASAKQSKLKIDTNVLRLAHLLRQGK